MHAYIHLLKAGLLLVVVCFALKCNGQKILVFDRDGHVKRIRFHIHDELEVRTSDTAQWIGGTITDIRDSAITIGDEDIIVSAITAIRYETRSGGMQLLQRTTSVLPVAGIALLCIYAINAVINNDYPIYSKNTAILAGAFIISKPIVYYLCYHKHKINKHHRLKVIDLSIN